MVAKFKNKINLTRKPTTKEKEVERIKIRTHKLKTREAKDAYEDKYGDILKQNGVNIQKRIQKRCGNF